MASEVDIVNLALGYLGDEATVQSIVPPDGSAQAAHASRFYPIARDALLEMHPWGFATLRASLAYLSVTTPSEWAYVYAVPNGCLNLLGVYDPLAVDDTSAPVPMPGTPWGTANNGSGVYTPQPFVTESLGDAGDVIYTNQKDAVLRYTARITDTTRFSPLFVKALAWLLASEIAGPLLKGQMGAEASNKAMQAFAFWKAKAVESDANQHRVVVAQSVSWLAGR